MPSEPIPATLIPGDGIGQEIVDATLAALEALEVKFDWDVQTAGLRGLQTAGDPLPQATLDSIRKTRLALKGPLETPSGGGYRSSNVRLREEFKLYANLRPSKTIVPGGRYDNIDLVVVRENNEGLYMGYEHYIPIDGDPHAVAMSTGVNTRQGSRRLLEYAFEYAIAHGRKKVTIVHKANIMKALTGIFLETGRELYEKKYKGKFVLDDRIIDACAMKLVLNPWQFDVLVTTNLFGDILSDEIAGLIGGLGMAPGANIGIDAAIFEAVHGSAPDIAGKGIANPIALMLAAAMMLDHLHKDVEGAAPAPRHRRHPQRRPGAHGRPRRQGHHRGLHVRPRRPNPRRVTGTRSSITFSRVRRSGPIALSYGHVPQHPGALQFPAADHRSGSARGGASVRAQGERPQCTVGRGQGDLRHGGRRGRGDHRSTARVAEGAGARADPGGRAGEGASPLRRSHGAADAVEPDHEPRGPLDQARAERSGAGARRAVAGERGVRRCSQSSSSFHGSIASNAMPSAWLRVAAAPPVDDARDVGLAVEPPVLGRALEADDQLLARQDRQVGLEKHPGGRQVEDPGADEAEIASPDDLAGGLHAAPQAGARTLSVKDRAHAAIVVGPAHTWASNRARVTSAGAAGHVTSEERRGTRSPPA